MFQLLYLGGMITRWRYLEELFLYASENQTHTIATMLQDELQELGFLPANQIPTITPSNEDIMGLKGYWHEQFGGTVDPAHHVLSSINYRLVFTSARDPGLDALSMQVYGAVRRVIGQFDGVEYFSMFSEDQEDNEIS